MKDNRCERCRPGQWHVCIVAAAVKASELAGVAFQVTVVQPGSFACVARFREHLRFVACCYQMLSFYMGLSCLFTHWSFPHKM